MLYALKKIVTNLVAVEVLPSTNNPNKFSDNINILVSAYGKEVAVLITGLRQSVRSMAVLEIFII